MGKQQEHKHVVVQYPVLNPAAKHVYWELQDRQGGHVFVEGVRGNGVENNRRKAEKAANHAARLADAEIERKITSGH